MNVEEARAIANEKFTSLIQPIIDEPDGDQEVDPEEVNLQVELLKKEIYKETGYEVEQFWVNPLGFGVYEITCTFQEGETRKVDENGFRYS